MTYEEAIKTLDSYLIGNESLDFYTAVEVSIECIERCKRIDDAEPYECKKKKPCMENCCYEDGYNACLAWAKGEEK